MGIISQARMKDWPGIAPSQVNHIQLQCLDSGGADPWLEWKISDSDGFCGLGDLPSTNRPRMLEFACPHS